MSNITAESLLSSLPSVLRNDEKMEALAESIADVLAARPEEINSISIYSNIQSLPEELLDILAKDFKVDWYGYDLPLALKRNQIENNFYVHKRLGTKGAITKALSDIYPNSTVYEWFEYNGNPYYFKVVIDVTDQTIDLSHDEIVRVIGIYKSLRSKLEDDAIVYRSHAKINIETGAGYVVYSSPVCGTIPQRARLGRIYNGGLNIETDTSGGVAFSTRMCGTDIGSII